MILEVLPEHIKSLFTVSIPKMFVGGFPSLNAVGVAIILDEGDDTVRHFGANIESIYKPFVTIVARGANYQTTRDLITLVRQTLDGYRYNEELAIFLSAPVRYEGRDDEKLHEFSIIFKTIMKE